MPDHGFDEAYYREHGYARWSDEVNARVAVGRWYEGVLRVLARRGVLADQREPIVELGSGHGAVLDLLRGRGLRGIGLELSPFIARAARAIDEPAPMVIGDATRLPLPDRSVGSIMGFAMIEHLPEPAVMFREVLRALRPGGTVVFTSPNPRADVLPMYDSTADPTHVSVQTPESWEQVARSVGFEAVGTFTMSLAPVVWRWGRAFSRGMVIPRYGSEIVLTAATSMTAPAPRPLKILHLAFEDHRRPSSGGGAVRAHEVNRRLAERHDVTMVTTRYPGATTRVEDGVTYRQAGLNIGHFGSIVTYFLSIPWLAWRARADLVVEEYAAPASSYLVPLWTRRPTVAVVNWMFARDKSREYHVPVWPLELWGTRMHRDFVVASDRVVPGILEMNPTAEVDVIGNGVDGALLEEDRPEGPHLLFLGRLEMEQKGLDLLIEVLAGLDDLDVNVVIAGDGPDAAAVQAQIEKAGLADRVELVGRVQGEAKLDLLASARVVCMPSRVEVHSLVALEAMACGRPVLAFRIPSFEAMADCGGAAVVEPFDVDAYRTKLRELLEDPEQRASIGRAGRAYAATYGWDGIAERQEAVFLRAAGRRPRRRRDAVRAAFGWRQGAAAVSSLGSSD